MKVLLIAVFVILILLLISSAYEGYNGGNNLDNPVTDMYIPDEVMPQTNVYYKGPKVNYFYNV